MPAIETGAPVVTLTPAAVRRVKDLIAKKGNPALGLRLGVRGGGCSGLSYTMALEEQARENDLTWETEGIRVWVDPKSARFLRGATLDFSLKNILEGGFIFQNPKASRTCGCGTSFQPSEG
jgi:iron-sulfur cluster assembly protein